MVEAGEGILLNAMGLPNPGMERFSEELAGLELKIPLVLSLSGKTPEDVVTIARKLAPLAPTLELNISCPHPEPKGKRKILISQDEELPAMRKFLGQVMPDGDLNMLIPLDADGAVKQAYGTQLLPETYIIDREGRIVARFVNKYDWERPEVDRFIDRLLQQ